MSRVTKGNPITIVQGGQYGSEAKGAITAYIAEVEGADIAVRTGAVNAGHTVYYHGHPYKFQQLPVAWVNPKTHLVIGAGALIHQEILDQEIALINRLTGSDVRERLLIDFHAGVHTSQHTDRSTASGRHYKMGATGKGCSEALIDKVRGRGDGYKTFGMLDHTMDYNIGDTAQYLNRAYDAGQKILIEGTQGTLLDLHTGPYPFTTHKSTLPAAWMAECGLSPSLPTDIVLVVRTYPIRVAGNSGYLPMETSWNLLARLTNVKRDLAGLGPLIGEWAIREFEESVKDVAADTRLMWDLPAGSDGLDQHQWADRDQYQVALSELNQYAIKALSKTTVDELAKFFEFTTVTKKLRRIGKLSLPDLKRAGYLCRPHRVAVTFMNYQYPECWYVKDNEGLLPVLNQESPSRYLQTIESCTGAPVHLVSYGPESSHIVRRFDY
jgi:adenylosuccinate synthase